MLNNGNHHAPKRICVRCGEDKVDLTFSYVNGGGRVGYCPDCWQVLERAKKDREKTAS